jgi:hypothetical protein
VESGRLAVVLAASSASLVVAATEEKGDIGASKDPWARFCAGGEIASTATAAGVAASIAQQLKYVSVIRACSCVVFLALFLNVVFGVRRPPLWNVLLRGR